MEPAPDDRAFLRRRLLGIGLGGAAVSLLPFLSGRASATTPPTTTSDTTAATTTTAPISNALVTVKSSTGLIRLIAPAYFIAGGFYALIGVARSA